MRSRLPYPPENISWRLLLAFIILGVTFFAHPESASAATYYYVDNTCANNGNGRSQSCAIVAGQAGPFNSIENMQAKVGGYAAGDFILLRKGQSFNERMTVTWSGTEGNDITFALTVKVITPN